MFIPAWPRSRSPLRRAFDPTSEIRIPDPGSEHDRTIAAFGASFRESPKHTRQRREDHDHFPVYPRGADTGFPP
jgi:hypothetical protein